MLDDDASAPAPEQVAAARDGERALLHQRPKGIHDQRRVRVQLHCRSPHPAAPATRRRLSRRPPHCPLIFRRALSLRRCPLVSVPSSIWIEDAVAINFLPQAAIHSELGRAYIKETAKRHPQTSPNILALESETASAMLAVWHGKTAPRPWKASDQTSVHSFTPTQAFAGDGGAAPGRGS